MCADAPSTDMEWSQDARGAAKAWYHPIWRGAHGVEVKRAQICGVAGHVAWVLTRRCALARTRRYDLLRGSSVRTLLQTICKQRSAPEGKCLSWIPS